MGFAALLAASTLMVPAAAADGPLIGVSEFGTPGRIARLQPGTLAPIGRPLRIRARYVWDHAVSPDGRRLAIGSDQRGVIELFDLRRWRRLGAIRLPGHRSGGYGGAYGLVWSSPRRLLALSGPPILPATAVVVDPRTRTVVRRLRWRGRPLDWRKAGGRLVVLSAPYGKSVPGRARIVSFAAGGAVRELRLGRIEAGYWRERPGPWRNHQPGLAVGESGRHAYVVATDGRLVADVNLQAGRVEYHALGEQAAASKGEPVESSWRHAELLPNGAIAVTGEDVEAVRPPRRARSIPYGLRLVDRASWSVRVLDSQAQHFTTAGNLLLSRRWAYRDGLAPIGLRAYDGAGRLRFSLFPGADATVRGVARGLAYVDVRRPDGRRGIHVVDLRTSRTLRVLPWRNVRVLVP